MKNIRWIITLLLLLGYGAAFGQQTKEQILKNEFKRLRVEMVNDAREIMNYDNPDAIAKLNGNDFYGFYNILEADDKANENKTKENYLKAIIGDANYGLHGKDFTGDFSTDKVLISTFSRQLKEAFEKDNWNRISCFKKDEREGKKSLVNSKSIAWGNRIQQIENDYNAYITAESNNEWNTYINNSEYRLFKELAKKKKQEKDDFDSIQNLNSCVDVQICQSFLTEYPNSIYKKQVEQKKKELEGLTNDIYHEADNEYTWDIDGKTYSETGDYTYKDGDCVFILHLKINKTKQGEKPVDKSGQFLKELGKCKTREAIVALLNKSDYSENNIKYKEDADDSYWVLCTDSIGWREYISFYREKGKHFTDARTKLEEARKPETIESQEEQTSIQTDPEEEKQNAVNGGADGIGSGSSGANGAGGTSDVNKPLPKGFWYLLAGIIVAALLLAIILRKRKKNQSQLVSAETELREENASYERCSTISACDYYLNTYPSGRFVKEVIAKKESLLDKIKKEEDDAYKACTTVTACDYYLIKYPKGRYVNEVKERKIKLAESNNPKPKPEPENKTKLEPKQKQGEWIVVGASVKGNGHIESNMPCQDNSKFEILGKGWGVAVVSDGAGSAAHSDMGSKVVVERGVLHFKNLVEKEGWMDKNTLPSDAEWLQKSYFVLKTISNEVEMVAKKNNVDLKSLSATCLAVVFSPLGLLAVHVGDGRMGCKTASGGWKAIMTPHKGDEANQTLFLISEFWDIPNYVQSGVLVPESIVVREPVEAFAVMSDGCESTAWLCTAQNAETGKYYDQNRPFEGFFNPLEETLASFHKDNVPEEERKEKWYKFIESGTKGFVKEQDDKTMILGVFL